MTSTTRNIARWTLLPAGAGRFLRRRCAEILGAMLVLIAVALGLALASYDAGDPSLNVATAAPPRNLMGLPGAYAVDLLLQSLGLAAALLGAVLAAWGWRLATHRGLSRAGLRIALLPVVVTLAAIALAGAEAVGLWQRSGGLAQGGLGGFYGRILFAPIAEMARELVDAEAEEVGLGAAALGAIALIVVLGLTFAEWRAAGRGLGRLGGRSARARVAGGRLRLRLGRVSVRAMVRAGRLLNASRARIEPSLGRGQNPAPARPLIETGERRESRLSATTSAPKMANDEDNAMVIVAARAKPAAHARRAQPARQAALDLGPANGHRLPPLDLLQAAGASARAEAPDEEALAENARLLISVLDDFGVNGQIVKVRPGPVVTLYELEPAPGTKTSRVIGLADDIARSMSAVSVRVAVVPGRNAIGIELPNARREVVALRELLGTEAYERTAARLTLVLGKDIGGTPVIADLARMPHLLIAGTTGSGKSVAINTMILSLLYRLPPDQCRFIMIDPKMLELSVYDGIPHLLAPVVTDPGKAVVALRWTVREMERRYRAMSTLGVRNIAGYNARLEEARRRGEDLTRTVQTGFDTGTGAPIYEEQAIKLDPLPFIVVIVDEMADLMLVAGKDVEHAVQRLAQMARAAGIHLIMATQRPSVDVITGTIKANFPTRISFQVTSKIDSRTILGEGGAETLLGQGDMLHMAGGGRITRVHGPLVTDEEVERVVKFLKSQGAPEYVDEVTESDELPGLMTGVGDSGGEDELYDQAVAIILRERKASTSFIQRHLQIGYNRAARIIERMEIEGVIGKANHVGKREVLPPRSVADDPDR